DRGGEEADADEPGDAGHARDLLAGGLRGTRGRAPVRYAAGADPGGGKSARTAASLRGAAIQCSSRIAPPASSSQRKSTRGACRPTVRAYSIAAAGSPFARAIAMRAPGARRLATRRI